MQTRYVRENDKFEIKIDFPQAKFDEYLKEVGSTNVSDLTEKQMIEILQAAFEDYQKGIISLDGLSVVANEFLNLISKISNKMFVSILEETGDMAYQVRQGNLTKDLAEFLGEQLPV